MDNLDLFLKFLPTITLIGGIVYHFATKEQRNENTNNTVELLSKLIKENHLQISDKIEIVKVEQSRLNTELELTKLRVEMIEKHR